jgi:hypothetical protein
MRIRDVRFPDGSVFLSGTDADVEKYGRCIVDLGNMLAADDQLLGDRESDALDCLQRHYPKTSRENLRAWFDTAEIYPPETMTLLGQMMRTCNRLSTI